MYLVWTSVTLQALGYRHLSFRLDVDMSSGLGQAVESPLRVYFCGSTSTCASKKRRINSYVANVVAAAGAALMTLGRLPLNSPRKPSRTHV